MTTAAIASRLVTLCREADFETAQKELYAQDAISIEPEASPMFEKETKGLDAIIEKIKKFDSMTEKIHSITVSDPVVSTSSFAINMSMDITMKGQERMPDMNELCVYKVKDGKIISEEFYV